MQSAKLAPTAYFEKTSVVYEIASDHWSLSRQKRAFDVVSVLLTLPCVLPLLVGIAIAVRLTSSGPVLFAQRRIGRKGQPFTILKFRTMEHAYHGSHRSVTTADNQRFTRIGPFLRRWKLDELPQLINVLKGDMSLVGPRPKLPEHQLASFAWRPGITGAATYAFACEEEFLATVPAHQLDIYYHRRILPAKHKLDTDYMRRASFRSDLRLLVDTMLRRWGKSIVEDQLGDCEEEHHVETTIRWRAMQ
ncbi:MAG: sugar transferase [Acidobacteria bacterium]|nr:sugar transferase [Acidobacteriota bacterium]